MTERPCTCHPDDNPPIPCAKKYALSYCQAVMEGRSQAYAECAKIADDLAAEASASQEQAFDQGNDVKGNMFWSSHTACLTIAQAIRSKANQ